MTESIIVALITGAFSFLGVYVANRKSQALIAYRLAELEKKQDKHNALIERTYNLENRMTGVEHDIKDLKERVEHK